MALFFKFSTIQYVVLETQRQSAWQTRPTRAVDFSLALAKKYTSLMESESHPRDELPRRSSNAGKHPASSPLDINDQTFKKHCETNAHGSVSSDIEMDKSTASISAIENPENRSSEHLSNSFVV